MAPYGVYGWQSAFAAAGVSALAAWLLIALAAPRSTPPKRAAADGGGVVFIPRHAALQPVPGEAPPPVQAIEAAPPLDAAKVKAAFETYHRTALGVADEAGRLALQRARARFLAEIG